MNKILIVDDDKNISELLRIYMDKEGFETVSAFDGQEALALFEAEQPDLVLLDVMMPKMDGWQVCREIRRTSQTPVIMLTAKTIEKVYSVHNLTENEIYANL